MTDLEMDVFKQIGARIRTARLEQKMSQADLAEKAHLCLPQISEVELGKVKMNLSTFIKIVEALQVSADAILRPDTPETKSVFPSACHYFYRHTTLKHFFLFKFVKCCTLGFQ